MRFVPREAISMFLGRVRAVWTARRTSVVGFLALLCFGIGTSLLIPDPAQAITSEIADQVANGFFSLVAQLLSYVVAFEGWLIAILVDVLVVFASYNGFATAEPVQMGWVLIRDLVNMFFIVVLLVSAFATIIGYDTASFHYSRVLPKLLLMAILINFSKTIIQLAIDFSQVLMLTFVNAFRSAAAGNFIQMFGLNQMLNLRNAQTGQIDYATLIPSYILAIVMLSIVISVLIIMVGFFIVRIVGLWLLLMFSPAAFFIQAVPDRLKKSLSGSASEYWSKLGSLLAGGPIMAFFIWLALALTQRGGSEPIAQSMQVYTAGGFSSIDSVTSATGFLTNIGTGPQIASFVIGVALMLIGLQTAVKTAGDVSKTLGSAAGKIKPFFAFTATAAAARFAGKAGYAGAKYGYNKVDRRVDLTGKLAGAALKTPLVGTMFRAPLAKGLTMRRKEREADAAKIAELTKGMTAEEKETFNKRTPSFATPAEKLAQAKILTDLASDEGRFKATKAAAAETEKKIEESWKKSGKITGKETVPELAAKKREIKREANAVAMNQVTEKAAKQLDEAKKLLTDIKAKDEIAKIDQAIEKNPALNATPGDFENAVAKTVVDAEKVKALSAEAISRGDVLMGLLGDDIIKRDAADPTKLKGIDQAKFEQFRDRFKDQKNLIANVDALVGYLRESPKANLDSLKKVTVQNDARGRTRLYDSSTGSQRFSEEEQDAINGLQPSNPGGINKAITLGLPLAEIQGIVGKATLETHLQGELRTAGRDTMAATNDEEFNKAWVMIGNIANQLKDTTMGSETQIKYLSSLRTGDYALQHAVQDGTPEQRAQALGLIKVLVSRAQEISRKDPATQTADEKVVVALSKEVKRRFPGTKEEYEKNNPGKDPHGYGGAVYRRPPSPVDQALRGIET